MDQQLIQLVNDLRGSIINLREEKKFSESIIQGLNHGSWSPIWKAGSGKPTRWPRRSSSPFSTAQLDGQYLSDIFGRETAAELLAMQSKTNQYSDRKRADPHHPPANKKIIGFSTVPQEDARGRKIGVIISLSDISELKYVRKEMEKMNRLSTIAEIASAVAHEVRNPLAGIKIMAQSIEEEAKTTANSWNVPSASSGRWTGSTNC